jgi:uncharacterized coiled-coil protein SlyX
VSVHGKYLETRVEVEQLREQLDVVQQLKTALVLGSTTPLTHGAMTNALAEIERQRAELARLTEALLTVYSSTYIATLSQPRGAES